MMFPFVIATVLLAGQRPPPEDLVETGARPQKVVFGFQFAEGPVWTHHKCLLWSDYHADTVFELQNGVAVPIIKPSQLANGHAVDATGNLFSCLTGGRKVVRTDLTGKTTIIADGLDGKKLNGPADIAVRSDGAVFFTDPLVTMSPQKSELNYSGVYEVSTDGKLDLVSKELVFPNGLALSPDEKKLYVVDTAGHRISIYDVAPSGSLSGGKIFAYITGEDAGAADGIKVDTRGDVYCSGPGGIHIFNSDGKFLGLIKTMDVVTNFCFGDDDLKTLYITSLHTIFKIRVKVAGIAYGRKAGH